MLLTDFENLNSISNISQEFLSFLSFNDLLNNIRFILVFTDPLIICIYIRNTEKHFCDQGAVRQSVKIIKMWFGTNIKYLSEPFYADFCCWKGISCYSYKAKVLNYDFFGLKFWVKIPKNIKLLHKKQTTKELLFITCSSIVVPKKSIKLTKNTRDGVFLHKIWVFSTIICWNTFLLEHLRAIASTIFFLGLMWKISMEECYL